MERTFAGVHFVLLGPDFASLQVVRSKLLIGGGVDVGHYNSRCTHLIVDKVVYDHPVCYAARGDGKPVVNSLWVDRSYDLGFPVDHTMIMYRPLRDLNGIPGAKDLVICLTGYKFPQRRDILTMISLMGAKLSKDLMLPEVTHLVCYEFEGPKYDFAKKNSGMVKLVNHLWLEDCLRQWTILPEADYANSTCEVELMKALAEEMEEMTP